MSCQHLGVFGLESCCEQADFGNPPFLLFFFRIVSLLWWYQYLYFLEWSHESYFYDWRCSDYLFLTSRRAKHSCHTAACGSWLLHSSSSSGWHHCSLTALNLEIDLCWFFRRLWSSIMKTRSVSHESHLEAISDDTGHPFVPAGPNRRLVADLRRLLQFGHIAHQARCHWCAAGLGFNRTAHMSFWFAKKENPPGRQDIADIGWCYSQWTHLQADPRSFHGSWLRFDIGRTATFADHSPPSLAIVALETPLCFNRHCSCCWGAEAALIFATWHCIAVVESQTNQGWCRHDWYSSSFQRLCSDHASLNWWNIPRNQLCTLVGQYSYCCWRSSCSPSLAAVLTLETFACRVSWFCFGSLSCSWASSPRSCAGHALCLFVEMLPHTASRGLSASPFWVHEPNLPHNQSRLCDWRLGRGTSVEQTRRRRCRSKAVRTEGWILRWP